jgi:hypothetical protein
MFRQLVAYKKEYKSTTVPQTYQVDLELARWVKNQRRCYARKEISVKRIRRLDSIGFVWKMRDLIPWEEMYQRLIAYKNKHKSSDVPARYKADPKLGNWVHTQRNVYMNKEISVERINCLESIGFVWDLHGTQWMEMYSRMVEYKKQNKSTVVPRHYTDDPHLGKWVSTQRVAYSKGKMFGKRLELLNTINFVWST